VLNRQLELKSEQLILIGKASVKIIKEIMYKIFTSLTQGTIKVLDDPQAGPKGERGALVRSSFSESDVEGERDHYG
jgi:hypothetical protein